MVQAILGAAFFGLVAYIGILLAGTISATPFEDGPKSGEPPVPWILLGAMIVGALLTTHVATGQHFLVYAIVICALAAIWCTDVRFGIVPDVFTLVPLALVLAIAFIQREPWPFISAVIAFVPFAALAMISKGRGMGWGDVKLATLGGAVLGGETALLAFTVGCLVAVVYAYARGRRSEVIAFAPYLAGAIGIALPLVPS